MAYGRMIRTQKNNGPFCQATGCFETASFYLVVKETEEPNYYEIAENPNDFKSLKRAVTERQSEGDLNFDGFKMILYFCLRHQNDFKYLIRGSEIRISKSCRLHV